MKAFFFFLLICFLAFWQTVIFPFNFLLVFVLLGVLTLKAERGLSLAFFSGFLLDLFSGRVLGLSSLGFLLPTFFLVLYRQRFSFTHPLAILGATFLFYFFFSGIGQKAVNFWEIIFLLVLVFFFRFLFPFWFQGEERSESLTLGV